MSTINQQKTAKMIKHIEYENIGSYELYLCIKALKMEKTILMLLVDNMDMDYIEKVVQHKKEDWG
jgi:hypothetical protein